MRLNDVYVTKYNSSPSSHQMTITPRETGVPIGINMTLPIQQEAGLPSPSNPKTFDGESRAKIIVQGSDNPSTSHEYIVSWGSLVYEGSISIDKSGYVEVNTNYYIFGRWFSAMNYDEYQPGWTNAGLRNIVGDNFYGYVDGFSSISTNIVLLVDTRGTKDIAILPYDVYGRTQTEWKQNTKFAEFLIKRKEPLKIVKTTSPILTAELGETDNYNNIIAKDRYTSNVYPFVIDSVEHPVRDNELNDMFLDSIGNNEKQHLKLTYLLNNTMFDESEIVSGSFSFASNGTDDNAIKFGNACSNEIQFQLYGSDKTQSLNLQNEFKVEFGFDLSSAYGTDSMWATLGYFKSKDISFDKISNIYTITAYDRMTHFDVDAKDFITHLDANTTYDPKDMFELLCRYVGVEYEPLTYSPTRKVSASNFSEISTLRELLNKIAEVYCSYAKITGEGKVKIEENVFGTVYDIKDMDNSDCYQLSETSQKKNYENSVWDNIAKFTWNELRGTKWNELYDEDDNYYFHGVNVVLSNEQVIAYPSTLSNEEIMRDCYEINNNPFYNGYIDPDHLSELPDVIRDTIYTKLTTNFQLPYSTDVSADDYFALVETGDIIKKYLEDGETYYSMPVYNFSFTWNGSFVCGISSARSLNNNM